jgi:hypothetical protein
MDQESLFFFFFFSLLNNRINTLLRKLASPSRVLEDSGFVYVAQLRLSWKLYPWIPTLESGLVREASASLIYRMNYLFFASVPGNIGTFCVIVIERLREIRFLCMSKEKR